jgi:transcriptional regulator with XRE-family HTH domain
VDDRGELAQMVTGYRRRLGWTQEELTDRAQLSVRTIRNIESGRIRGPAARTVRLVAEALGSDDTATGGLVRASLEDPPLPVAVDPPAARGKNLQIDVGVHRARSHVQLVTRSVGDSGHEILTVAEPTMEPVGSRLIV